MSRIVIVGRCAAGKDYLKNQFIQRGFLPDISYTTRKPRDGEINGKDYYFISEKEFNKMIDNHEFYEFIKFGDNYYGTGLMEWTHKDIFIMEPEGIKHISPEDRQKTLIIFLDTPKEIRFQRMIDIRKWSKDQIEKRSEEDFNKFWNFEDYDIKITNIF